MTRDQKNLGSCVDKAAQQIPPAWPLASSVAVNPFFGQTNETLAGAAQRLARIGGISVTMPRAWYQARIATKALTDEDLAESLSASPHQNKPTSLAALKAAAAIDRPAPKALPTVADLATSSGMDWPGFLADRFGVWAGSHFDQGQALWAAPGDTTAWTAYRNHAINDLSPEIIGLKNFALFVANTPENPLDAISRAVHRLGLSDAALNTYFHQLLQSLGGWSQYARYQLWRAELAEQSDEILTDFLAIRLLWEEALFDQYEAVIGEQWASVRTQHEQPLTLTEDDVIDEVLQEAAERAAQRDLSSSLNTPVAMPEESQPLLQAAFCIDVRSEVFRRALENVDPKISTLGFAGFFGMFAKHKPFASDVEELRLPVLLNPTVTSCSGDAHSAKDDLAARYKARAKRAWGRFKLASVSSFAFVEAMGPVYITKLTRDALGLKAHSTPNDPKPQFAPELDLETKITSAETVLRAMSLTSGFARLVVLAGHGANVVNNPHESGLHCGACGGYSGEVNSRLLAALLNEPEVRTGLKERGITVPDTTLFMAALHDTTTDRVTLYDADSAAPDHGSDVEQARQWLVDAGRVARGERALRLPRASSEADIDIRARDWAEVRPEWALAGCKAFIAAPRKRTSGRSLEGRAFLHDYEWRKDSDNGFGVLELIMTAPVVVASWISLQYYGSTVAPGTFGSGNKLLHNVVGGVGVFEGNGGLMRAGLPWQSVHDGENYIHEPLRLSVCIEAPREAMNDILSRHDTVRALFDNKWLHLFAMDDEGQMSHRYVGNLKWEAEKRSTTAAPLNAAA